MAITINTTLPNDWDSSITYHEGDKVTFASIIYRCKQTSINNRPDISPDYWNPLEIYLKDASVMEIGDYSGEANFWERDNIYIDGAGWVYVNNENTGINVMGPPSTQVIEFEDLTPAQKEQIKGDTGPMGPQGPQGEPGPQGPPGEVDLTDEQIEVLKGDTGASAYDIWLENGHTGTEQDFLTWLQEGIITLDKQLDANSTNGVENKAIYKAYNNLYNRVDELLHQFSSRIEDIENNLKYERSGEMHYFRFAVDADGNYGYMPTGTSNIIPFNSSDNNVLSSSFAANSVSIFANDMGVSSESPANITIGSLNASMEGTPSDAQLYTDNHTIYGTNVVAIPIADAFNETSIYEEGIFYNAAYGFHIGKVNRGYDDYYTMNFDYDLSQGEPTPTELTSKNDFITAGIWFEPSTLELANYEINIEVEPITEGQNVTFKIGLATENAVTNDWEGMLFYNSGVIDASAYTINTKTIISCPIRSDYYLFFGRVGEYYTPFKITKISTI